MNLLFCGDIVPGGILPYQKSFISKEMFDYMHSFDFCIGTLECAIGNDFAYDPRKMAKTKAIVYARDEDTFRLQEMGINVVTLANNHFSDLGIEGMAHTMKLLSQKNIFYCGAGKNFADARKPIVLEKNGEKIAIIGCLFKDFAPTIFHPATNDECGVYQTTIEEIQENIAETKKLYNNVIIMPHWAEEHTFIPPIYCYEYARKMIDAGADAIIGSHPHVVNPHIKYNRKDIYFSLGNFLFPDFCMDVPRPMMYPETLNGLNKIWAYPKKVEQKSLVIWKDFNRLGMIVEMHADGEIKTNYKLTKLSVKNILSFHTAIMISMCLKLWALSIKLPYYKRIRQVYVHHANKIHLFLSKIKVFNIPIRL